ncbi:hypothetical protein F5050DRAFT_1710054 [Lentinula boryana]|uniref:Uncharacterized protein n=1 Tax=Lentinula boryana TaxID=40481 RepID=A0ABQ8QKJ5_9AGAR|nr:hypothetical protein F5050DRAFT_1710054 [Lentinula boryana]
MDAYTLECWTYIHEKSSNLGAIPRSFVDVGHLSSGILLVGPGSFLEVLKILPPLTQPDQDGVPSFYVVALSLPDFAFSKTPKQQSNSLTQYAEVCNNLMLSLGYEEYITQGGDRRFYNSSIVWSQTLQSVAYQLPRLTLFLQSIELEPLHPPLPRVFRAIVIPSIPFETLHFQLDLSGASGSSNKALVTTLSVTSTTDVVPLLADSPTGLFFFWVVSVLPSRSRGVMKDLLRSHPGRRKDSTTIPKTDNTYGLVEFPQEAENLSDIVGRERRKRCIKSFPRRSFCCLVSRERPVVEDLQKMSGKGGPAFGIVKDKNG